ncbi:MAG TPA: TonB-dependent receptor, partial [Cyclobacteriaceae bacterium]
LSATYRLVDSLSFTTKISMLYAWNKTIHDYLQLIPSNRFENTLRYGFGDLGLCKKIYVSVTDIYISKQSRVPANSDYAVPPSGYMLLNANVGFSVLLRKQLMNISFSANNLLNTTYRDYMDRFRYFMDEPGRNFTLRVRVSFGTPNHNESNN